MQQAVPTIHAKVEHQSVEQYIQHHAREEENEMFPKARRLKLDLDALAQQMPDREDELKAKL